MSYISPLLIPFFLLFTLSHQSFPPNRYEYMIRNLSTLTQSTLNYSETTTLSSIHNYYNITITNLRLISPLLSKLQFNYLSSSSPPTISTLLQVQPFIFTFATDIQAKINYYFQENEKYTLELNDFFFQLNYSSILFEIHNQTVLTITNYAKPTLFFSNATSIGTLKSFSFFNEYENNRNTLINFFDNAIQHKLSSLLTQTTNLIEYDALMLFSYMKQYYNNTPVTYNNTDIYTQINNITVESHDYTWKRFKDNMNTIELQYVDIILLIGADEFSDYIEMKCKFHHIILNHCKYEFNMEVIEMNPALIISEEAEDVFNEFYMKTFDVLFKEYFNDTQCE